MTVLMGVMFRRTKVFLKYYHPERLEKLMSKYRQAALLIQRSKCNYCEELSGRSIYDI